MPCRCLKYNSRQDPTNTAGLRRQAFAEIRKRLRGVYDDLRPLIYDSVARVEEVPDGPVTNRRRYYYELLDTVDMDSELSRIIREWFQTGTQEPPPRWFMGQQVGAAYERGTTTGAERLQAVSAEELGELATRQILQSRPYMGRIARVRMRAFEEMQGFTEQMRNDLRRTLSENVARGVGPREIARDIRERLSVNQSRAERIARTEIGTSFRDSRRELAVDTRDRLGLNVMMQWVSALAPTTRPEHAERHLNLYTPEEVADFYSRDANGINCLCSQQEVIVTQDGEILGERKWTQRDREEVDKLLNQ